MAGRKGLISIAVNTKFSLLGNFPPLGVVVSISWGKVLDECFAIPSPFPLPRCSPAPHFWVTTFPEP